MVEPLSKRLQRPIRNIYYRFNYLMFRLFRLFITRKIDHAKIKRIVVIEQTMIGDLLVATPSLKALRRIFPKRRIDLMMFDRFRDVMSENPDIDGIIGIERSPSIFRPSEFNRLLGRIKKGRYDLAVILHHGTFANSLLLLLAGIRYRIGCTKAGLLPRKGFFLTHKSMPALRPQHVVEQNLDVISLLDDPKKHLKEIKLEMHYGPSDTKWADRFLEKSGLSKKRPIIAIHAGTRHPSHEWFNDRFADVADWLVDTYGAQIVFTGDGYDKKNFVDKIRSFMKHDSVYAKTTLKQCVALLSRCALLLSLDTSMVHIGAASGIPVLGLYGSGRPVSWSPWGKKNRVIFNEGAECTSCRKTHCTRDDFICMDSISVEQVKKALSEML